jgi:hypothetical protein
VQAQAPDGRPLTISRDRDGWSVSVQSSPNSAVRVRGRELAPLLAELVGAERTDHWIAAVTAEAERKTWQPLGWRGR